VRLIIIIKIEFYIQDAFESLFLLGLYNFFFFTKLRLSDYDFNLLLLFMTHFD